MLELIHQRQPTQKSCVSTCLAMLAGIPAEEVVAKHHIDYYERKRSALAIMEDLGIVAVPLSALLNQETYKGCLYLVAAQSINYPQTSHQIILDCRSGLEGGYRIYDPQMGNDQYHYYIPHYVEETCLEPLAVRLVGGWFADFRILECPALGVIS